MVSATTSNYCNKILKIREALVEGILSPFFSQHDSGHLKAYIGLWKSNTNDFISQITTRQMIRMANDSEDGNGLRYEFLKKRQVVCFSKVQGWLENR